MQLRFVKVETLLNNAFKLQARWFVLINNSPAENRLTEVHIHVHVHLTYYGEIQNKFNLISEE